MNLPNKLTVIRILLAPIFLLLLLWEFPFHNLTAGLVFGAAALTRYVRRENRPQPGPYHQPWQIPRSAGRPRC